MKLIEKVSDTLLSTKNPGENAIRVTTQKIEMVVQRGLVEEIGKESLNVDGGGVKLPDSNTLFGSHKKSPLLVDTQV
jgi:hypothetical protein